MSQKHQPVILVAPLDWGLGHATRCIPIINHLIELGCNVLVGAEGKSYTLLKSEFPNLLFLPLQGYRITYSKTKRLLLFKILYQLPKILRSIKREHRWLAENCKKFGIDGVISDNRYGLWHPSVSTVFITHQLQVKGPNKWIESLLLKMNYQQVNNFDLCWVPDAEGSQNFAGNLSHPSLLPKKPIRYIGPLSRLSRLPNIDQTIDLLIVLSGPEPQRTILENILLDQLDAFTGKALLVRGLPGLDETLPSFKAVTIKNHLTAQEMSAAFMQSKIIVCRSGYTTIMDIMKLGKKSIMIPTPGQTEQEYLAYHLQSQQLCLSFQQHEFNLTDALNIAASFPYNLPTTVLENYKPAVKEWLAEVRKSMPQTNP